MKHRFITKKIFSIVTILLLVNSCSTDDIKPTLNLSSSSLNLNENDQSGVILTVNLNSTTNHDLIFPVTFSGTAQFNNDFTVSSQEIIVSSGNDSGNISIFPIDDQQLEGIETVILEINSSDVNIFSPAIVEIILLDDESDTDGDNIPDSLDSCPDLFGYYEYDGCPFPRLIINEVLYDPPSGDQGDANGDGVREAQGDEFIEFYNLGTQSVDISGYTISDAAQLRHVFPEGTVIPSNGSIVVFGSGDPINYGFGNSDEYFGGSIVQSSSTGLLNMNNAGDFVTVSDQNGVSFLEFDIEPLSNNPDESYTRNPDLVGDFEQHAGIPESNNSLFSPGKRLDGSSF